MHRVPNVPRRWQMPIPKITLKQFRFLLARRSKALSRLRPHAATTTPSSNPNPRSPSNGQNQIPKTDKLSLPIVQSRPVKVGNGNNGEGPSSREAKDHKESKLVDVSMKKPVDRSDSLIDSKNDVSGKASEQPVDRDATLIEKKTETNPYQQRKGLGHENEIPSTQWITELDKSFIPGKDTSNNNYDLLKDIDPVAANRMHPNNHRKISQYLSLYARTGVLPSTMFQGKVAENLCPVLSSNARLEASNVRLEASNAQLKLEMRGVFNILKNIMGNVPSEFAHMINSEVPEASNGQSSLAGHSFSASEDHPNT
ncbi:tRNA dimethylallyltransferase 2 [Senna tora]|uniref:tRNA dimethylallyltransferase 2 n=1 Tax=Senna tora TaxID=362788 RepID=A0A835CHF3_9FABA|nr:tRNA dimethylallyltransferase 2 [Senna tora]